MLNILLILLAAILAIWGVVDLVQGQILFGVILLALAVGVWVLSGAGHRL